MAITPLGHVIWEGGRTSDASEPEDLSTTVGNTADGSDNRGLATGPPAKE
jgi:hypothetical protein